MGRQIVAEVGRGGMSPTVYLTNIILSPFKSCMFQLKINLISVGGYKLIIPLRTVPVLANFDSKFLNLNFIISFH